MSDLLKKEWERTDWSYVIRRVGKPGIVASTIPVSALPSREGFGYHITMNADGGWVTISKKGYQTVAEAMGHCKVALRELGWRFEGDAEESEETSNAKGFHPFKVS